MHKLYLSVIVDLSNHTGITHSSVTSGAKIAISGQIANDISPLLEVLKLTTTNLRMLGSCCWMLLITKVRQKIEPKKIYSDTYDTVPLTIIPWSLGKLWREKDNPSKDKNSYYESFGKE